MPPSKEQSWKIRLHELWGNPSGKSARLQETERMIESLLREQRIKDFTDLLSKMPTMDEIADNFTEHKSADWVVAVVKSVLNKRLQSLSE